MTATELQIPGFVAGRWTIDPVHSYVGFVIKHLMVSKVRGRFAEFEGEIVTAESPLDSRATATIQATSIDTSNAMRDGHPLGGLLRRRQPPHAELHLDRHPLRRR